MFFRSPSLPKNFAPQEKSFLCILPYLCCGILGQINISLITLLPAASFQNPILHLLP
jgi:hypothetical protein